jgi:hypothetical protein
VARLRPHARDRVRAAALDQSAYDEARTA